MVLRGIAALLRLLVAILFRSTSVRISSAAQLSAPQVTIMPSSILVIHINIVVAITEYTFKTSSLLVHRHFLKIFLCLLPDYTRTQKVLCHLPYDVSSTLVRRTLPRVHAQVGRGGTNPVQLGRWRQRNLMLMLSLRRDSEGQPLTDRQRLLCDVFFHAFLLK